MLVVDCQLTLHCKSIFHLNLFVLYKKILVNMISERFQGFATPYTCW